MPLHLFPQKRQQDDARFAASLLLYIDISILWYLTEIRNIILHILLYIMKIQITHGHGRGTDETKALLQHS
jgi:hypothetical protein